MKRIALQFGSILLALAGASYLIHPGSAGQKCYTGMCDASAVASLDNEFFAVADDEDSVIRVYSRREEGAPIHSLNLATFLGLPRRAGEADLEGAARLGDRIYWISSHGCDAEGKPQPSRHRLFATSGLATNGAIHLQPIGRPYTRLLQDLSHDPRFAAFDLAGASRRPPKAPDALNIEGLGATPEGHLLMGFRNPIPDGKALLVPLLNPAAVIEGRENARLGEPILLDLGGLGIRSIGYREGSYWIVAGSYDGEMHSGLYQWRGERDVPTRVALTELADLNPESIAFFREPEGSSLWVVSDDGTVKIGGRDCKRLKDSRLKRFRAVSIPLPGTMAESR